MRCRLHERKEWHPDREEADPHTQGPRERVKRVTTPDFRWAAKSTANNAIRARPCTTIWALYGSNSPKPATTKHIARPQNNQLG